MMDISFESTSEAGDQTATLFFSANGTLHASPSYPPTVSQHASTPHSPARRQQISTPYTPVIGQQDSAPRPPTTSQQGSTSHPPSMSQQKSTSSLKQQTTASLLPGTDQVPSTPHPPATSQQASASHPPPTNQQGSVPHAPATSQPGSTLCPPAASQQTSTPPPSQHSSTVNSCPWCGFKICGDNIDKSVHCRHMRIDKQTQSLHYFHSYAVRDRVDCSRLSDDPNTSPNTAEEVIATVLPSDKDDAIVHDDFAILVARILCKHMSFFKETYADVVDWHIPHKFSKEMSQKSEVVNSDNSYNYLPLLIFFKF